MFARSSFIVALLACLLGLVMGERACAGEEYFEQPPILYSQTPAQDDVAKLIAGIKDGKVKLAYHERFGYLPDLLAKLEITKASQMLVFSKTSLQLRFISPSNPRAVYFNDETYIGWVRGGEVIEISATDPKQGAIFYTLDQARGDGPVFKRQTQSCLQCHGTDRTLGVPGHLVRSVYTDREGQPVLKAGAFNVDHCTPLIQRWGGWYVTGKHGDQLHMGNLVLPDRDADPSKLDLSRGANVVDLSDHFRTENFLTPDSDIVALMVLEHQAQMHNRITRASYEARRAARDLAVMNELRGVPADTPQPSVSRRIRRAGDELVKYMLMIGEPFVEGPVTGTSTFAADFQKSGPSDTQGRSLRQLSLDRGGLFRYPCSYLIYSDAFAQLPPSMRDYVHRRLYEVLTARDRDAGMDALSTNLSRRDRRAILEILRETKPGLPKYWFED